MCHPFHQILDSSGSSDQRDDTPQSQNRILPTVQSRRGWLAAVATAAAAAYAAVRGHRGAFAQEAVLERQGRFAGPPSGGSGGTMTTQALGEEGGPGSPGGPVTTQDLGEEGGGYNPPSGPVTTQALGEEGGGYNPPSGPITTQALGEEGGGQIPRPNPPTTLALGEEGGGPIPGPSPPTTLELGEEGCSSYPPYRPYPRYRNPGYSPRYQQPFWRRNSR